MNANLVQDSSSKACNQLVWGWKKTYQPKHHKALTVGQHREKGRNNKGVITARHRGGGHKRLYRRIDFRRDRLGVPARITGIEYDPNRSARIALVAYADGTKGYILHAKELKPGDGIVSGPDSPILVGNTLPLSKIPLGTSLHNIEFQPGKGGQIARAAGSVVQLIAKEGKFATLRMPSGEVRLVSQSCNATIGQVAQPSSTSHLAHKAGWRRWLGKRPKVRGAAMNPVDHPHGGGEGKAPIGRKSPMTPWGLPALGRRTREKHRYSDALIIRRRKSSKKLG
uniref:ribosomal protein L2 n=1 Tax=Streptosarcina costaricana TaxID=2058783 RepID=UPI00286BA45B|nr:ribosomal protein L2 [Streptosarcina costaricana]WKT08942.1 ribosomal protein L2 [Streptosarcina costaricana]